MTNFRLKPVDEIGTAESLDPDEYTGPQYIASSFDTASEDFDSYSHEEAVALADCYWPEWGVGSTEASNPPSLLHAITAAETRVVHLQQIVVHGIQDLNYIAGSEDQALRNAAVDALKHVYRSVNPPSEPFLVGGRVFSMGRKLDDLIGTWKKRLGASAKPAPSVSRVWTVTGLGVSAVAALMILFPMLWPLVPAVVLIRQLLTVRLGGNGTLPFEGLGGSVVSREAVYRCWATHLSDAILLMGFVGFGLSGSAPVALIAAVSVLAAMLGVILRLSAHQLGIQVVRLHLERLMRVWPPLIALVIAALVPSQASLAICLGLVFGPLAYGIGEQLRAIIRITRELRGQDVREVMVVVASTDPRDQEPTIKVWMREIPASSVRPSVA